MSVLPDTGNGGFFVGTMDLAQKLNLTLKDLSGYNCTVTGPGYTCRLLYRAHNVCVKVYGQEKRGILEVQPEDIPKPTPELELKFFPGALGITFPDETNRNIPTLGIEFFRGAVIQCNPDATLDTTFPGESDKTRPPTFFDLDKLRHYKKIHPTPAAPEEHRAHSDQEPSASIFAKVISRPTTSPGGPLCQGHAELFLVFLLALFFLE